jgi:hypothetical protein
LRKKIAFSLGIQRSGVKSPSCFPLSLAGCRKDEAAFSTKRRLKAGASGGPKIGSDGEDGRDGVSAFALLPTFN